MLVALTSRLLNPRLSECDSLPFRKLTMILCVTFFSMESDAVFKVYWYQNLNMKEDETLIKTINQIILRH